MRDITYITLPLKEINKSLDEDWQNFIKYAIHPKSIRPNILASWERCKRIGVDPYDGKTPVVLKGKELQCKLKEQEQLLSIVRPYMESINKIVEGSGYITYIADHEAVILHVTGDRTVFEEYKMNSNIRIGANWSEKYVGTTSVAVVLKEGKPIQIWGEEHYCLEQRKWTCSGVPIKDITGKTVAVLGMAGKRKDIHLHTLGMLVATEMAVENQLQVMEASEKLLVTSRYLKAVVDSVKEGILTIDKKGIVTYMNTAASKILFYDSQEAVGRHISEIVDFRPVILDVLESGEGYSDNEFIINSKRGRMHFVKSAVPIKGEDGEIDGVVDVFREIKEVKRLVNQMVGAHAQFCFEDIIGESQEIKEAISQAEIAAHSISNVLLIGESGTGKELFAQAIHNTSKRNKGPFIAVNCGAIPRDLIESEFFGYEEGAFTGARRGGRPGKFEMASGGTIFLDEIGEMPLDMQVRLLRVLQERQVVRVGGSKIISVDVRVIAATNKDLAKEMEEGTFRRDLFWRLNVLTISIPALCQRKGDIMLLTEYFMKKHAHRNYQYVLDDKTRVILEAYNWPGNVRELENALERAINFTKNEVILSEHLPKNILNSVRKINRADNIKSIQQVEKEAIQSVLDCCKGNISQAAKALGVARNTLYSKMKKFDIKC